MHPMELAKLTEEILRPAKPEAAKYKSARDILKGIEAIRGKSMR